MTEARKYGFAPQSIDLEEYSVPPPHPTPPQRRKLCSTYAVELTLSSPHPPPPTPHPPKKPKDDLVKQGTVIFVVATYGEGEPTDNAKEFYSWLMSGERESDELNDVQFTVFGCAPYSTSHFISFTCANNHDALIVRLGNRTYEHYNAVGRNIDRRLEELSAHRFYERGEGDDDSSLEEDFAKWKKGLWKPLCALHKLPYESPHEGNNYEVYVPLRKEVIFTIPLC